MCVSAATLNLQQAQKLEWRDTDSDEEDDLPSSKTFLGLPLDGLEEEIGSQEASSPVLSFSSYRSNAHRLAAEVEHQLNQLQQAETQSRVGRLHADVQQIHHRELCQLYSIREELTQRQAQLAVEDEELQKRLGQQRDQHLQVLRQEHHTKKERGTQQIQETMQSQQDEQLRQEEVVRQHELQKQQQQLQHEQQQKEQQQREQQQHEQEQQQLLLQQQQQAQQQQQQQQPPQLQQAVTQPDSTTLQPPTQSFQDGEVQQPAAAQGQSSDDSFRMLRIAESAAQHEAVYRSKLQEAQAAVKDYVADDATKKERRDIDKQLTKVTQQISGTQYNVKSKADALAALLSQLPAVQRAYAYLQLAKRFLSQCENQISLNPPSCFPYAEVAVAVAQGHPGFAELIVARLHEACPLTVPKCHMFKKATAEQHYEQMGYQKVVDPKTGKEGYESPDRYLQRLGGYVSFYAAVMQSEQWPLRNPAGISSAWQYMARLLNALPANRTSATALHAFLHAAGYRMHQVFKGQFVKLLQCTYDSFWATLNQSADPDVRATAARIKQFIMDHAYGEPPEGSQLPEYDQSTDVGLG